jgi:catechol 2,3-dioxygenase-like lactoylglutathione lyase family enzyme
MLKLIPWNNAAGPHPRGFGLLGAFAPGSLRSRRVRAEFFSTLLMLSMTSLPAVMEERPPVTGQVTFLYYEDLPAAERFYREVLGLSTSFELDWVKIFPLSSGSSVGLVNATKGSLRPAAVDEEKPVMVSLVVDKADVDRWHSYLKSKGVDVGEGPKVGADGRVLAFAFKDPGGYTLEVFAWRE